MDKRITVYAREASTTGTYGRKSGGYVQLRKYWASVSFVRGIKAMREGALDAYDTVMIRMRYNTLVNRDCRISHKNKMYQIESLNVDYRDNIIQITATEIVNP